MQKRIKQFFLWLKYGKITEQVKATAGDNVVAEVEYKGRFGRVIGYWAYGHWCPWLPYKGDNKCHQI